MANARPIAEILNEAKYALTMDELRILESEILMNKYQYTLSELKFAANQFEKLSKKVFVDYQ